ncbi:MAG: DUF4837 family protein [Gemmatimonadetes bacterium]|nr:DUF4837 family protein [Gemmatimonadota bacterium]
MIVTGRSRSAWSRRASRGRSLFLAGLLALTTLILSACGEERVAAIGDADDILVGVEPILARQIQRRTSAALAPPLFAIPNARTFQVTYQDPTAEEWPSLRQNRQVLLIGKPEDPWIVDALAQADEAPDSVPAAPALFELEDVWAADQRVTVLLVPESNPSRAVLDKLDSLSTSYERRYREGVVARMFADGPNQPLSDSLDATGFNILVPKDYEWTTEGDVYLFRKIGSDSGASVRHVTVTWRTPIPQGMQGEGLLAWRRQLATDHYGTTQRTNLNNVQATQTTHRGNVTYQLLGMWSRTASGRTERGPFILRAEICTAQDRMYLLDAWLYAPNQDQHEHMVELESILNSFRCGSGRAMAQ